MYASTPSVKQPLKVDLPYRSAKPPAGIDLQPQPLQARKKKVKGVTAKAVRRTGVPAQGTLQRAGVDAPGSLAEMPGHMQYQRLIGARAAQARRVREDQLIDEQRRLMGDGATAAERTAVKRRRKPQMELSGAMLSGQMFYPDPVGRGFSTSGTRLVNAEGVQPAMPGPDPGPQQQPRFVDMRYGGKGRGRGGGGP